MWSPRDISSLTAWLRADRGVTLTGGFVSTWEDPILAQTWNQATAGDRPGEASGDETEFNGLKYIEFDGAGDRMGTGPFYTDAPLRSALVTNGAGEIWVVFQVASAPAPVGDGSAIGHYFTDDCFGDSTNGVSPFCGINQGNLSGVFYDGAFQFFRLPVANYLDQAIGVWRWNGTTFTVDYHSATESQTSGIAAGSYGIGDSRQAVGYSPQFTTDTDGRIASILYFNAELSAGDRAKLTQYLKARYLLSMMHDGQDPPDGLFFDSYPRDFDAAGHPLLFASGSHTAPRHGGHSCSLVNPPIGSGVPYFANQTPATQVRSGTIVLVDLVDPANPVTTRTASNVVLGSKQGLIYECCFFRGVFVYPYSGIAIQAPTGGKSALHFQVSRAGGWKNPPTFTGVAWGKDL